MPPEVGRVIMRVVQLEIRQAQPDHSVRAAQRQSQTVVMPVAVVDGSVEAVHISRVVVVGQVIPSLVPARYITMASRQAMAQ